MGYKVIVYFEDLQDANFPYQVGDSFPRSGMVVNQSRLQELSSNKNKRGIPLIVLEGEKIPTEETPKKRGRKPSNQQ